MGNSRGHRGLQNLLENVEAVFERWEHNAEDARRNNNALNDNVILILKEEVLAEIKKFLQKEEE